MSRFSKKEAILFGWQSFKNHWRFLLGLTFFVFLFNFLLPFGLERLPEGFVPLWLIIALGLAVWILEIMVSIGLVKIYLTLAQEGEVSFSDLFVHYRFFFRFLLASSLSGIFVLLGLFLLVAPGIIISLKLSFWPYAMIDEDLGIIDSLKRSWRITRGSLINLFLFNLLLVLINLGGFLGLGVLSLVTFPVTQLATVFVYRRLVEETS